MSRFNGTNANPSEHGEEAIKEINADFGIPASFYRVDVRDQVAVEEAINGIVRDFGGLDVLLCSAGKFRNQHVPRNTKLMVSSDSAVAIVPVNANVDFLNTALYFNVS